MPHRDIELTTGSSLRRPCAAMTAIGAVTATHATSGRNPAELAVEISDAL